MNVRKVAIHELDEFIKSKEFLQFETKPITPKRAASYLRNPQTRPNDFVLYLLVQGSKLLAFRSLWADRLTGEKEPFAWLSGNWVHPDYRRKGLSEQLLLEALKDWNGRLMLSNYSPIAEQLILKTQKFHLIHDEMGERFYLFAKTSKIFSERYRGLKFLFPVIDFFINQWASVKTKTYQPEIESSFQTQLLRRPDQQCLDLLKNEKKKLFLRRGPKAFKWILKYPWLSTNDKRYLDIYPFSSYAKTFQYFILKTFSNGQFGGFLLYSIRDGHLKTLFYTGDQLNLSQVANHLCRVAAEEKIEMMTVLDADLSVAIRAVKNPFIHHKSIDDKIYSSFKPSGNNGKIQSGDGDFIFT